MKNKLLENYLHELNNEHYKKICVALSQTGKLMNQIDKIIDAHGGWPLGR